MGKPSVVLYRTGTSVKNKTGTWRSEKPIVDLEKCNSCNICVVFCPEGCMKLGKKGATVDYDYCKGCGICAAECPIKAIAMVREEK